MLSRFAGLAIFISALLVTTAVNAADPTAPTATLKPIPCWFNIDRVVVDVQCALAQTAMDHARRHGRSIAFGVVRISFKGGASVEPPMLFFPGGPGAPLMTGGFLLRWMRDPTTAKVMFGARDWVLIEQRGAGFSFPALNCENIALSDAATVSAADAAALSACAKGWSAAGVDLRHYRNADVVTDAEAIRRTLKLGAVDVFGISYGGSYALTYLRMFPKSVRAVVLDSGVTPEGNTDEDTPMWVAGDLERSTSKCANSQSCRTLHPDLSLRLQNFAESLTAERREDLARVIFEGVYDQKVVDDLPGWLDKLVLGGDRALDDLIESGSTYQQAQTLSVLCQDEIPFESRARMHAKAGGDPIALALSDSISRFWTVCEHWPKGPIDPILTEPVYSKAPVLFLVGGFDPCCGAAYAHAAARWLPAAQVVEFPALTHVTTAHSSCARSLLDSFLRAPGRKLDAACVRDSHAP